LDIAFRTRKLERVFNSKRTLDTTYGDRIARTIAIRLAVLKNARVLAMVPTNPPERRHQLSGKRSGQYAVDLVHPCRLIFEPNHDPVPRTQDGGIDVGHVTAITIIEVINYH
jgi:proteic killer suppression protein